MEEKATCAQRIRQGLEIRGMTQKELCEKTGIPKSAMSQYCSGAFAPKQNRTASIAKVLNVSEGWLMGYDVPMEPKKSSSHKIKDMMNPPWKSDKKSRLYMCIDSWLLSVLETTAKNNNMTLEDFIEEVLYWDIERRIEDYMDELDQIEYLNYLEKKHKRNLPSPEPPEDATPQQKMFPARQKRTETDIGGQGGAEICGYQKGPTPVSESGPKNSDEESFMRDVRAMSPVQQEQLFAQYDPMRTMREQQKDASTVSIPPAADDKAPESELPDQS